MSYAFDGSIHSMGVPRYYESRLCSKCIGVADNPIYTKPIRRTHSMVYYPDMGWVCELEIEYKMRSASSMQEEHKIDKKVESTKIKKQDTVESIIAHFYTR